MDVDLGRKRIALSMKAFPGEAKHKRKPPARPLKRASTAQGRPKKKAPFNNPFADLLGD
jgi:hypothetical protein